MQTPQKELSPIFVIWAVEVGPRKTWFISEKEARLFAQDLRDDFHNPIPFVRSYAVTDKRDLVAMLNTGGKLYGRS